jgi:hypothetical protein
MIPESIDGRQQFFDLVDVIGNASVHLWRDAVGHVRLARVVRQGEHNEAEVPKTPIRRLPGTSAMMDGSMWSES